MKSFIIALAAFCISLPLPSQAQEDNKSLLSFGIGQFDILDDEGAADIRIEYRSGHEYIWNIRPWAGLEANSKGSVWGGGGFLADIHVSDKIYVTPSFGAGLYTEGDSDLDLGFPIIFRSQIETGYVFDNDHRAGIAFGHSSNAGLDENNPGTEVLNVYYHVPVNSLF